jgi:hypothetical protein
LLRISQLFCTSRTGAGMVRNVVRNSPTHLATSI